MGIDRPYKRTSRQLVNGTYRASGNGKYVSHPNFATSPHHYQRAFSVLQKDFLALLDYIEPASENLNCYSYRTHEILMRARIEIEANFQAIFADNGYSIKKPNIKDYEKIEASHRLSSYRVRLPTWHGDGEVRQPFGAWAEGNPLRWYQIYSRSKHNRHELFHDANFEATVDAMCGLTAVITAQFMNEDFSLDNYLVMESSRTDGFETAIGGYFHVSYPTDWPDDERYDFDWKGLQTEDDPFQQFDFR